jgi:hypothetical protein
MIFCFREKYGTRDHSARTSFQSHMHKCLCILITGLRHAQNAGNFTFPPLCTNPRKQNITKTSQDYSSSVSVSVSLVSSTSPSVLLSSSDDSSICFAFFFFCGGGAPVFRACIWPARESVGILLAYVHVGGFNFTDLHQVR